MYVCRFADKQIGWKMDGRQKVTKGNFTEGHYLSPNKDAPLRSGQFLYLPATTVFREASFLITK